MNHKIKQKTYIKVFAVVLTVGIAGGLAGCKNNESKVIPKNSVSFYGIDYVIQEDIGLNVDGYNDFYGGLGELCEKVGTLGNTDVYKIRGLEQSDWIYLDSSSMISADDPYGGIYRASTVQMDTIDDFNPNYLDICYLTRPTSEQSGTEVQIFETADSDIIEKIAAAIRNGKAVSSEKQAEVIKAMYNGDDGYHRFRLEFLSESYPKLVYRLDYAEDKNGKYYIGYYGDITPYRIIEIDNTLHEYIVTQLGE